RIPLSVLGRRHIQFFQRIQGINRIPNVNFAVIIIGKLSTQCVDGLADQQLTLFHALSSILEALRDRAGRGLVRKVKALALLNKTDGVTDRGASVLLALLLKSLQDVRPNPR